MDRVTVAEAPIGSAISPRKALRFRAAARSEAGPIRSRNEDFVYCGSNLIAVADGVGGNVHGDIASALAIRAIGYLNDRLYLVDPEDELLVAARYATDRLAEATAADPGLLGMATTLTALRLDGDAVAMLHIGDSRAYRMRDGAWLQLTRDDSFVQDLVDVGALTAEQARTHPARSVVSKALDGRPVRPHVSVQPATCGDRYLVCSDGLTDYADEADIRDAVARGSSPEESCDALIELALAARPADNVSCVVADVEPSR